MQPHDYVVTRFDGDYVTLTDVDTQDELLIAIALLPMGIDIGTKLHYENLSYEIME